MTTYNEKVDKNTLVFDAVDYGADPTGVADSGPAINTAITACRTAGGGIVYLRAGTFKISTTINLSNIAPGFNTAGQVTLRGAGRGITTLTGGESGFGFIELVGSNRIIVESMSMIGTGTLQYGILGGRKAGDASSGEHLIRDVHIYGAFTLAGIYMMSCELCTYRNIFVYTTAGPALALASDLRGWTASAKYTALSTTTYIIGGNGVNKVERADLLTIGLSSADSPLVLEYVQNFSADSLYVISSGAPLVVMSKCCTGISIRGMHQEWNTTLPGATEPYGILCKYVSNPTPGQQQNVRFDIRGSSLFGIYAEDNTVLADCHIGAVNFRLSSRTYQFDAYIAYNTCIDYDPLGASISGTTSPKYRIRGAGSNNQFTPNSMTTATRTGRAYNFGSGTEVYDTDLNKPLWYYSGTWYDSNGMAVTGPTLKTGSGTPESAVTAPVGSLYLRSDGSANKTLYVKESGVSNTGWRAFSNTAATYLADDFGADKTGVADSGPAINSAITACLAAGGGIVQLSAGTYKISTTINLSNIHPEWSQSTGTTIALRGAGMHRTYLSGGETGYGFIEIVGSNRIGLEDFQIVTSGGTKQYGILGGRTTGNASSGEHYIHNVKVFGAFSLAGVFMLASEVNIYDNLVVYATTGPSGVFARDMRGYTGTAKYTALTTSPTILYGGNGVNRWTSCQFLNSDPSTTTGIPLTVEYAQTGMFTNTYVYGGGGPLIKLNKRISHLTFIGLHQEWNPALGNPEPYGIYAANGSEPEPQDVHLNIIGSSVYSIYGEDGVIFGDFTFFGSAFRGTKTYQYDVDSSYGANIRFDPRAASITGVQNPLYRARTTSINNVSVPEYFPSTTGEFVPDLDLWVGQSIGPTSGHLTLTYFTAEKTETISNISMTTGASGAGATPTTCIMGIYSVANNGDLTLVATTTNDTTLFAAAQTTYTKALNASWAKKSGVRYAAAVLVISGAAMPGFVGFQPALLASAMYSLHAVDPRKCGRVTGVTGTTLPSTISAGSIIDHAWRPGFRIT